MKKIQAFIRPERLNKVYDALKSEGYCLTVFEGEGTGKYTDPKKDWPSLKFPYMHSKIVKLEMICKDDSVEKVCNIMHENGSTGEKGDGLIYVSSIEEIIRVRDGAKGVEIIN